MNKKGPSLQVEKIMKKRLELEYDFYNFIKDRFHRLKAEYVDRLPLNEHSENRLDVIDK